jgi:hypothetical protein
MRLRDLRTRAVSVHSVTTVDEVEAVRIIITSKGFAMFMNEIDSTSCAWLMAFPIQKAEA